MTNLKKYNIFNLITSFAKLLVEIFVPLILYNIGFTVNEIILFLIFKYLFCSILVPLAVKFGNTYSYTLLMLISSILFTLTYTYLNILTKNIFSLIFLSLLFASYLTFYWIGRHTFAMEIIEDKKTTDNVSLYSIISIIGSLPATYIGALLLKYFGSYVLTIIVFILMILSIIPLSKIENINYSKKTNIKKIIKTFPKNNYIFIIIEQLRYIAISLFPLYIFLNVKKEFTYLGIINFISGVGSIIYIYLLSKKMDKNKKDYLKISSLLLAIIYFLKININSSTFFLIIMFFEGISKSALDTIILRNTYVYGKNYDTPSYVEFIELLHNLSRTIFLILIYITKINLKTIIIISIIGITINAFIKFDDGKYGYRK